MRSKEFMIDKETPIILFDGVCSLCNNTVKFIIKRDGKGLFEFAPLQSASGKILLNKFKLDVNNYDSFILIVGNKYYSKSTAGLKVLRGLGGLWRLAYVFIYFPESIRDFVYDRIAKSRYRIFGKEDRCMVPTPDIEQRFL